MKRNGTDVRKELSSATSAEMKEMAPWRAEISEDADGANDCKKTEVIYKKVRFENYVLSDKLFK